MRVTEPLAFSVQHVGRGGNVVCQCEAGKLELALEMQTNGDFCVWLRGTRLTTSADGPRPLSSDERRLVLEQLRAWLDATGRAGWIIER